MKYEDVDDYDMRYEEEGTSSNTSQRKRGAAADDVGRRRAKQQNLRISPELDEKIRQRVQTSKNRMISDIRDRLEMETINRELKNRRDSMMSPSSSSSSTRQLALENVTPLSPVVVSDAAVDDVLAEIEDEIREMKKSTKKPRKDVESKRQEGITKRAKERGLQMTIDASDYMHDKMEQREAEAREASRSGPNLHVLKAQMDAEKFLLPSTSAAASASVPKKDKMNKSAPRSHRMLTRAISAEQEVAPFRSRSPLRAHLQLETLNERGVAQTIANRDEKSRALRLKLEKKNATMKKHLGKGLIDLSLKQFKVKNASNSFTYWNDPNELVERLRLIVASTSAGHTGHHNEISSIIEELREAKVVV